MRKRGYQIRGGQWVGGVALPGDSARRVAADSAMREESFLREQFRGDRAAAAEAQRDGEGEGEGEG